MARKAGMRELANFDKLGVEYPYTSVVVLRQTAAKQYPNAKQTDANMIVESAFMKRIEESGFIRALYKK